LPAGTFSISALGGYGFRNALLSDEHKLTRGMGDLAFGYAITDLLNVSLSFDGRYDKHSGVNPDGDEGYVGDPHLMVRFAKAFGNIHAGAQLGVWVPGKDAPSVAANAISVDARGLLSIKAGPGIASLAAGFRFDNSAKSVDDPGVLSVEDRVSLGVSEFHAALASVHYMLPMGRAYLGFEGSTDVFVGSGAPGPILRAGVTAGINLSPQWALFLFTQLAKVPGIDADDAMNGVIALVPYEPAFTGGLGLGGRFGGSTRSNPRGPFEPNDPRLIEVIEYAELSGTVLDDTGKPIVGAKVTVKLKNNTGSAATDDKGAFWLTKVPIGKTVEGKTTLDDTAAEIVVEVDGKKPKTTTLVLVRGTNSVAAITLDPSLPPAHYKAVVRAANSGKALAGAIVRLEPGGHTATTDADGLLSLDVPPGTYKVTASMTGYKDQTLETTITGGVVVDSFELRK
jgi:hypothetical protein